jgi:WD40 repeat protein
MTLDHTFHHHTACVNALALSSDGDKLLSASESLPSGHFPVTHYYTGDDADIVVWDILTGEKVQVIRCAFHDPIRALAWIPRKPGLALGFFDVFDAFEAAASLRFLFVVAGFLGSSAFVFGVILFGGKNPEIGSSISGIQK